MQKSYPSRAPTLTGVLRIILGLAMLAFGIMKVTSFGDPTPYAGAISVLQEKGLSFLSYDILYRLGALGEIVAGLLLLLGFKTRVGAGLTILILIFAVIADGLNPMVVVFGLIAGFLKYAGSGKWAMQPESIGCHGGCCGMGSKKSCNCKNGACTCKLGDAHQENK